MMRFTQWFGGFNLALGAAMLAGCASEDGVEAKDSYLEAEGAPTATVSTHRVVRTSEACTLDVAQPTVKVPGYPAVEAAIASALAAKDADALCADSSNDGSFVLEGDFTVHVNKRGLLSLTISESSFLSRAAHPVHVVVGRTLDLRTGALLKIGDVLTPSGVEAAITACKKSLADDLGPEMASPLAERSCAEATSTNGRGFTVDGEGLHLQLDLPHAVAAAGSALVRLEPASLKPGPVRSFLAGPPGP